MQLNRIIVVFTLVLMLCIPISLCVLTDEVVALEDGTVVVEKRNIFEEFYYRLVLKDTKDFYDYIMLGTFIVGLLIVMVFQNTHYYLVKIDKETIEPLKEKIKKEDNIEPKYEKRNDYKPKNNNQKRKNYQRKKKLEDIETSSQN